MQNLPMVNEPQQAWAEQNAAEHFSDHLGLSQPSKDGTARACGEHDQGYLDHQVFNRHASFSSPRITPAGGKFDAKLDHGHAPAAQHGASLPLRIVMAMANYFLSGVV
jgi:hypothetical protein